jgi:hypothetical protein
MNPESNDVEFEKALKLIKDKLPSKMWEMVKDLKNIILILIALLLITILYFFTTNFIYS